MSPLEGQPLLYVRRVLILSLPLGKMSQRSAVCVSALNKTGRGWEGTRKQEASAHKGPGTCRYHRNFIRVTSLNTLNKPGDRNDQS